MNAFVSDFGHLFAVVCGVSEAAVESIERSILTKNGLYPCGVTLCTALHGPAAGGSTGRPEEKIPRAFRFKPGIRLACCCYGRRQVEA